MTKNSITDSLLTLTVAGLFLLFTSSFLIAQTAPAEEAADDEEYEVEEETERRDPFWPVGYVSTAEKRRQAEEEARLRAEEEARKAEEAKRLERLKKARENAKAQVVEEAPEPDWTAAVNRLKISGYAEKDGVRSCLIAGQPVTEGTSISFPFNGFRYTWTIKTIGPQKKDMRFVRVGVEPLK